jgi:RHS repeat-associated protein
LCGWNLNLALLSFYQTSTVTPNIRQHHRHHQCQHQSDRVHLRRPQSPLTYSYDAVGHLLTSIDPDSKYTYTYDLVDRITSIDNLGTTGVPNVLLTYSYDAAGNLLSVTEKINGIQKGTNAYTYDILNRVTKLTQSGTGVTSKRVDMTYNAVNQIATLNRYSDLTGTSSVANTSYTYDLAGRLQTLTHQHGGNTLASYGLTYDNANRIIQSAGTDGTQDYSYDSTNQLTTANHTTQTDEAYSYDANGNRTSGGASTGTNNQLLTDGTYNYEYDGEGNRTKRTEIGTGKVTEYVWDYRNRLTSVLFKDAGGNVTKTIAYSYDVNDRRISKKVDGVVAERYVYDGSNIALVFDGAGTQTHRYLYGIGVDQVLADERGGTVVWALSDNQGTVRDVVDGNGTILNHVVYDSFGKVKSQSDATVEFRYGYTGREQDGETGLDYYRARYYDAANGRFISEDPLGFNAGDTNIYRYVGNSPTNWVDPSGLGPSAIDNRDSGSRSQGYSNSPISQPLFGGGSSAGGGRSSGNGWGVNTLRGGGNVGGGNSSVGSPVRTNPTVGNYGSPRSLIQNGSNTLPGNSTTPNNNSAASNRPKLKNKTIPVPMPVPEVTADVDPNCPEKKKKKKCENGYVYRGDTRSPNEIFEEGGFWPQNPQGTITLKEHVTQIRNNSDGSFNRYIDINTESQWVSTSNNEQHAATYTEIVKNRKTTGFGYVYKVCRPDHGRDVFKELKEGTPKRKEISFEGGFDRTYIESYRKVQASVPDAPPKYILGRSTAFPR